MRSQGSEHDQLLALIQESLSRPLSLEESFEIRFQLDDILLTLADDAEADFYGAGVVFRRWLDDWDTRQRDANYAQMTTDKLRKWCESAALAHR